MMFFLLLSTTRLSVHIYKYIADLSLKQKTVMALLFHVMFCVRLVEDSVHVLCRQGQANTQK